MRVLDPSIMSPTLDKVAATAADRPGAPTKETMHAARDFEQIFLRQMLAPLEKTGHAGQAGGAASAGSEVYSSMVVNALAEAISSGGGIGLADMIARSMTPPASQAASTSEQPLAAKAPLNANLRPIHTVGPPISPSISTPLAPAGSALPGILTPEPSISTSIAPASPFGSLRPRR